MTKKAKGILIAVLGLGLAAGVFVVLAAAVVGVGLIAAASEEENGNSNNIQVTQSGDQPRRKSGVGSTNSNKKTEYSAEGSVPPELVGRWLKSEGGGEVDFTGKSRYRSNRLYLYEFSSDGTVHYTTDRETLTILQCEIKERKTASGSASTDGETLNINLGEANLTGSNSCEGGETTEKTLPGENLSLKWNLKTEGKVKQLCLAESEGEVCYDKQ